MVSGQIGDRPEKDRLPDSIGGRNGATGPAERRGAHTAFRGARRRHFLDPALFAQRRRPRLRLVETRRPQSTRHGRADRPAQISGFWPAPRNRAVRRLDPIPRAADRRAWPVFRDYARRDTTRREHFAEAAKHLGLRSCTSADRQDLLDCATNEAMSTDSGSVIVLALLQQMRDRRIILPAPARIERIATGGRARSRRLAADAMVADIDAAIGGRLGLRISKSAPRKPSNVRISTQNILTFDGFFSSLELRAWPCRASVRKPFSLRRGVWPSSGTSSSPPIAIRRIYKKVRASNSQVKWLQQAILSN